MLHTRRALLRRGRGAGFLAAVEAGRRASEDLLECVLHDPRWDRQVEERESYYAELLLITGTNLEDLRRRVSEERHGVTEAEVWLPIGVLAEMSRRGGASAQAALAGAIRDGPWWDRCLVRLGIAGGVELVSHVVSVEAVRALVSRVGSEAIANAEAVGSDVPWERWSEHVPALRGVIGTRDGRRRSTCSSPASDPSDFAPVVRPGNLASLSTKSLLSGRYGPGEGVAHVLAQRRDPESLRLLETAADTGNYGQQCMALRALGKLGVTEFIAAAEDFLRSESRLASADPRQGPLRRAYLQYLVELPATHTLPLARRWLSEPWPLSLAAGMILERQATPDDLPVLEREGVAALERSDMYRLCAIVDAISTAGPHDSLPFLGVVYEEAPYSYARLRAVRAMSRCGLPGASAEYLTEALWDCERQSRALACRAMHGPNGVALSRVKEMASDPYEEDDVREAARCALEGQ